MELAQHLHASWFLPVKSTFQKGTKNNQFTSWPGLTQNIITKNLPMAVATVQAHIHEERYNLQRTKQKTISLPAIEEIKNH